MCCLTESTILLFLNISDNQATNFQKASTTLDASVKIYGYRVDDTLHTGYRILDSLSRGEQPKQPAETPKQHHKAGSVNTIETNLHNIEMDSSDLQFSADPLFHLMSRRFDEGGVKGLLLANLVCAEIWVHRRVWMRSAMLFLTQISLLRSQNRRNQSQKHSRLRFTPLSIQTNSWFLQNFILTVSTLLFKRIRSNLFWIHRYVLNYLRWSRKFKRTIRLLYCDDCLAV